MNADVQETQKLSLWNRFLQIASFPVLMALVLTWGVFGKMLKLSEMASMIIAFVMTAVVLAWIERKIPYQNQWNESQDDVKTDAGYLGLLLLLDSVGKGVLYAGGVWFVSTYGQWTLLWPSQLPMVVQVILAIVIGEFLPYWYHRISHEYGGILWKIHSIHHSSERLYWLNGARFHPINAFLNASLRFLPLMLLGTGAEALYWTALIIVVLGFFNHANADVKLGPLNWFFGMSELHRWHHHKTIELSNANYGGVTIFWDIVFGTRIHPKEWLPADQVGLQEDSPRPHSILRNMLAPFCDCWAIPPKAQAE